MVSALMMFALFLSSRPLFKFKTVNINIKDLLNQSEEILHDLLSIVFFLSFIYYIWTLGN